MADTSAGQAPQPERKKRKKRKEMQPAPEKLPCADYLDGLPAAFADMADTILIVDSARLPVHRAILAANSDVFATLFISATAGQSTPMLEVPLLDDAMWDVYTALIHLYKGCTVITASSPEIGSVEEAKALVRFAHKYSIMSLIKASEDYLVELAQDDVTGALVMSADNCLFDTKEALVSCIVLAEACSLNRLLAHCELFMIRSKDMSLWYDSAVTSNKISNSCLLRMLRGAQIFMRTSEQYLTKERHRDKRPMLDYTSSVSQALPPKHVSIAALMGWNKH